jgi:hypothetical protein
MSSSLADGFAMMVCRNSLPWLPDLTLLHFVIWDDMRNTREEHQILNAGRCMNDTDVLHTVQIILNFKYP